MHCPARSSWPAHPACERVRFHFSSLFRLKRSLCACAHVRIHMFTCVTGKHLMLVIPSPLIFPGERLHYDRFPWPQARAYTPFMVCVLVFVCVHTVCVYVFVYTHYNCFPWPPARTLLCGLPRSACLDNSGAHVGWNMAAVLVCSGELSYGMCA